MYGVNWKKISEEIVVTKTQSQLASHTRNILNVRRCCHHKGKEKAFTI